jgi:hypothetical protein
MKEYTYSGPLSGVSLKGHGDIMLHPGGTVELPEDHEYTARLVRKGWLKATDTPPKVNRSSSKKKIEEDENHGS